MKSVQGFFELIENILKKYCSRRLSSFADLKTQYCHSVGI